MENKTPETGPSFSSVHPETICSWLLALWPCPSSVPGTAALGWGGQVNRAAIGRRTKHGLPCSWTYRLSARCSRQRSRCILPEETVLCSYNQRCASLMLETRRNAHSLALPSSLTHQPTEVEDEQYFFPGTNGAKPNAHVSWPSSH